MFNSVSGRAYNAALLALAALSPVAAAIVLASAFHYAPPSYFPTLPPLFGLLLTPLLLAVPGAVLLFALRLRLIYRLIFMSVSVLIAIPIGFSVLLVFSCAVYDRCL